MNDPAAHLRRLREHLAQALDAVDALLAEHAAPEPAPDDEPGWLLEYVRAPGGPRPGTVHRADCWVPPQGRREPISAAQARALLATPGVDACPGCRPAHPDG